MTASASSPAGAAGHGRALHLNGPQQPVPVRIGKYEVEAEIDHGALVRVFRALDRDIARPVTLKVLADVGDRQLIERFRREVATAAKLCHAGVIRIYELGEHVGLPFAAMQYAGDDDVRRAIETRRPLTLLQKALMMWQVAEAVQAAHRGGLAFVGIRPSGIALGSNGSVTIQDFGIVRLTGPDPDESYASPEELTGDFSPDPLCDVFAFGMVCYELLTGTHPFLDASSGQAKIDILHHEPAPLRDLATECPEALEQLVHRALEKHRELRYQSLDDLQYDAEPILRELKRTRAGALLADARRLMDAQELDEAEGVVREILELDPENPKALRFRTVVRGLLQRRSVRPRLEALWREADEEASARRFGRAVEILRLAVRLDSADLETKSRLAQMCLQLQASERAAQLVNQARRLLDEQSFTEAHAKASEALEKDPQSPGAAELLDIISEAIKRRETEARIEQELAKAKSLLLQQSFNSAISILAALREQFPESPVVEHWLAHAQTQKAEAERQSRLQAQLKEARGLLEQHQFGRAVARLEALRAEFPEQGQVSDLLAQAQEAMERALGIAEAVAQCDQLRREEQFDKALEVLDAALGIYAGEPALRALRQEVEQQWQSLKSAAAVRQALDQAQWLLEQDRPDLAAEFLRERSASFSDHPEVVSRLAAIEEMLPAWEKQRFVQDALGRIAALEQRQQWRVALTLLEEALEACPASGDLLGAAERLRSRLREQERRHKLARRLEMIRQKVAVQAWSQALSLIEVSQTDFPDEPELQALLEQAQAGIRRCECETIVAEVRQCLADGETNQAEEILRKALESWPEEPAVQALREELQADKKFEDEWHAAQVFFGRRQFQEAEQVLVQLAAQNPNRQDVQALLETVRAERAASEEQHFYKRGREKALKLIEQEQFEQAADLLRNLLSLFPDDPILKRDFESILAGRDRDQREHTVAAAEDVNAAEPCELPVEPSRQPPPVRILGPRLRVATSARVPLAVIASVVLLLVSASAAVWSLSRHKSPAQAPASPPIVTHRPIARQAQSLVATPQPPASPPLTGVAAGKKPQAKAAAAVDLRPGANFQEPKLISGPTIAVPATARERGVYGVVNLQATVDKEGTVTSVTVQSGHPLLVFAAKENVLKRRYQPAMLNGQPLEFKFPVRVVFER